MEHILLPCPSSINHLLPHSRKIHNIPLCNSKSFMTIAIFIVTVDHIFANSCNLTSKLGVKSLIPLICV